MTIVATHVGVQRMPCYNRSPAYLLLYNVSKFYHLWSKDVEMAALFRVSIDCLSYILKV